MDQVQLDGGIMTIQVPRIDDCYWRLPPKHQRWFVRYPEGFSSRPMTLKTATDYAAMFKGVVYEIVEWGEVAVPYVPREPCFFCALGIIVAIMLIGVALVMAL